MLAYRAAILRSYFISRLLQKKRDKSDDDWRALAGISSIKTVN
ncbi:hypothetical protein SAMN05421754_10675 [Nitrosomonas sp. Nm58]|jgi:hypothetical protein|nr:hypothetical protein SAMN05421754_10675 [Nitrosomonas sp. Nm58]